MKKAMLYLFLLMAAFAAAGFVWFQFISGPKGEPVNVLRHVMEGIDGGDIDLADYQGKVVMIVNVASKCGFTGQYAALEALYKKYQDRGFVILGFPSNDFLHQEPGTDGEIKTFCSLTYGVTFPMFSKITVIGKHKAALYRDLTERATNPNYAGGIKWNFTKFLIGRDGKVVDRFAPVTSPDAEQVIAAVEKALGEDGENHR